MTKSQQIEKDLVDAMTDVSILLIWEGAVGYFICSQPPVLLSLQTTKATVSKMMKLKKKN